MQAAGLRTAPSCSRLSQPSSTGPDGARILSTLGLAMYNLSFLWPISGKLRGRENQKVRPQRLGLGGELCCYGGSFPQASDSPSVKWEPSKHLFHAGLSNVFIWMALASLPDLMKDHSVGGPGSAFPQGVCQATSLGLSAPEPQPQ